MLADYLLDSSTRPTKEGLMRPGIYLDKDDRKVTVRQTATGYTVRYADTGETIAIGDEK